MRDPRTSTAQDRAAFRRLPPGPRWPALLQTIGLTRFRHRFVPAMHRRYGDVFTVRMLPHRQPLVLFTRPEQTREVFAGDPENFHAGKGNAVLGPVMGEHSLLLQDGDDHRRARTLLMPAFHGAALRGYQSVVTELAADEVARWTPGVPFRSLDRMNALTLEVILRVVFGVTDEGRLAQLRPLVNRIVDTSPILLLGWGHPVVQRLRPWRALAENLSELDAVLYAEIADRRLDPRLGSRSDVLSRLLTPGSTNGTDTTDTTDTTDSTDTADTADTTDTADPAGGLTDVELRDQLVTLLLAGHETTATALSWSLHELARDDAQLARAHEAAVANDEAYLEAVLKESMRMHPVIPMVVRRLMQPATISGIQLPRGVNVAPSILLSHARTDTHGDPEVFRPQRFLDGEVQPHTWIPFGGGVRRCIGAGFSLMEGVAVLREVLLHWHLSVPDGPVEEPRVRNITSVPRHGALLVVHLANRHD